MQGKPALELGRLPGFLQEALYQDRLDLFQDYTTQGWQVQTTGC